MTPLVSAGAHKYTAVYQEARRELAEQGDLRQRCEAGGFAYDPGRVVIAFLGRRFGLSATTCELESESPDGGAPEPVRALREKILILDYLRKASGEPLEGRLVGFDQLPGGRFYGGAFKGRVEVPLARLFSAAPEGLAAAAARLGGAKSRMGDCAVVLSPFPRVPVTLVVWRGEGDAPGSAKVLFDAGVEGYLSTEDLAVLGEVLVDRLKEVSHV